MSLQGVPTQVIDGSLTARLAIDADDTLQDVADRINALEMGYLDFDHPVETDFRVTQERCILCGACAANCPTGAMKMMDSGKERVLSLCGTILNRQELLHCGDCKAILGPARYLDFIRERGRALPKVLADKPLCDACARKTTAARKVENAPVK